MDWLHHTFHRLGMSDQLRFQTFSFSKVDDIFSTFFLWDVKSNGMSSHTIHGSLIDISGADPSNRGTKGVQGSTPPQIPSPCLESLVIERSGRQFSLHPMLSQKAPEGTERGPVTLSRLDHAILTGRDQMPNNDSKIGIYHLAHSLTTHIHLQV